MKNNDTELVVLVAVVFVILAISIIGIATWFVPDEGPEVPEDNMRFVSGTEYFPNQAGQLALLITNFQGNFVTFDYDCNYTITYPNKTLFVQGNYTSMNGLLGTYYTEFTIPDVEGVYEYGSICVNGPKTVAAGKSFHVTREGIRAVVTK